MSRMIARCGTTPHRIHQVLGERAGRPGHPVVSELVSWGGDGRWIVRESASLRGKRTPGWAVGSGRADAGGLQALVALADLELHALTLVEAAEAVSFDPRVVHEDVVAAVVL